jgi:RNA polymerase sigma-70 factor (ECF subfamily)
MLTDPDIQLMLRFKEGDQRSFHLLFDKYKKRVINYCYRYCGYSSVAEELAQETFLRVYKASDRYRPEARFSTWLFKIAANVCLNEMRKPVYRVKQESIHEEGNDDNDPARDISTDPDQSLPDALLETRQNRAIVSRAIEQLPEQQRAALLLKATEGFSYREIGLQIQCSEKHVKTLIYRGRQRMKKLLAIYWGRNED